MIDTWYCEDLVSHKSKRVWLASDRAFEGALDARYVITRQQYANQQNSQCRHLMIYKRATGFSNCSRPVDIW